jgi:hypothetical protein
MVASTENRPCAVSSWAAQIGVLNRQGRGKGIGFRHLRTAAPSFERLSAPLVESGYDGGLLLRERLPFHPKIKTVLLDLDGTIYFNGAILPGALEALDRLATLSSPTPTPGEWFAQTFLLKVSPHRFVRWVKLGIDKQPPDYNADEFNRLLAATITLRSKPAQALFLGKTENLKR